MNESKVVPQVACHEWTHVDKDKPIKAEPNRKPKRGSQSSSPSGMQTDVNIQRVQELRTQIAILERQLAVEIQVPQEYDEQADM